MVERDVVGYDSMSYLMSAIISDPRAADWNVIHRSSSVQGNLNVTTGFVARQYSNI